METSGAVCAADERAAEAGAALLRQGGNALDAAIAASAVMAVTSPHLCGIGGDLFALVHDGAGVRCLNASGRAGSGADPAGLRADGHREMPLRLDVRSVTVPGCVDGWLALHAGGASMPLAELLAPAIGLAKSGFRAGPLLAWSVGALPEEGRRSLAVIADQVRGPDSVVTRAGVGRTLVAIAGGGRDAFYAGEFGEGLIALGGGQYGPDDLHAAHAEWVTPLAVDAFGVRVHTVPPNSQGYLLLAAAVLADTLGLPDDPDDPQWAHLLIECATAVGFDRPAVLHDATDGAELVRRAASRVGLVDRHAASVRGAPGATGDTTYLCTADRWGRAVSLINSNAAGFGSWLVEPSTGINLHNRGLGFSLEPGHPAELRPGARPPHTLAPALATADGQVRAVFGTMGGDAQPQILLQLAARLFLHGENPRGAVRAARWALHGPVSGFDTWTAPRGPSLWVEEDAPSGWLTGLRARGHRVIERPALDNGFGHAHAIVRSRAAEVAWDAAADPRARIGAAVGTG